MINEPLKDAVEKISAKTAVGSLLRTADWERVPLALRERAQFSAGVESVRVLQTIQDRIQGQIQQQREQLGGGKEAIFDRSSFIDALREIAIDEGLTPADPDKRGTIEDITSVPRLGLIYDTQIAQAQGYARWKLDQSEGALLLWPAQEFTRVEDRAEPRTDWPKRFAEAAQAVGDDGALRVQRETGRMIGLKNSPLWAALSRFGTPWPPFDFGSGMGFEDIDREEAVALGLLGEKEVIDGAEKDFNEGLQASAKGLSPELLDKLKEQFGKQIRVEGDSIWWRGDRKGKALVKPAGAAPETEPDPTAHMLAAQRAVAAGWPEQSATAISKLPSSVEPEMKTAKFISAKGEGATFYRPGTQEISLSSTAGSWGAHPWAASHEFGHHVHFSRGIVTAQRVDPEFAQAMAADKKLFEERWEKLRGPGWRSQISAAKHKTQQEITKDLEGIYGIGPYKEQTTETKFRLAAFADSVAGLTEGRYGWGHTRAYYKFDNHGAMEVFANAFASMTTQPDPVYQESFPNVVAFLKKSLNL